jgi:hypothetical protein
VRYYSIVISDQATGIVIAPDPQTRILRPQKEATFTYSSFVNGKTVPGAQNIEIDIPLAPYAAPLGGSYVRVWGVSLQEIGQASNLNGKAIAIYGGMQKGLPLADPAQAGLLAQGYVQQGFGNWQGTDQSLDLIILAGLGTNDGPANVTFNWKAGTQLAQAVATTLATAFPAYKTSISLSSNLVLAHDEPGVYSTIEQFSQYLKRVTIDILGGQGADIALRNGVLYVYDGTTQTAPKAIKFTDLIGQPTWIDALTIQTRCVMRADLGIGDYITLPPSVVTTTSASLSQYRKNSAFQGSFQIGQIRHTGSYRQPDANSWVTTIDAYPMKAAA